MITFMIIWLVVLTLVVAFLFIGACNNKKTFNEWVDGTVRVVNKNVKTAIENNEFILKKFIWIEKVMAHKNPRHSDPECNTLEGINVKNNKRRK